LTSTGAGCQQSAAAHRGTARAQRRISSGATPEAGTLERRGAGAVLSCLRGGDNRGVSALTMRLRVELRARWRAWGVIALLIGVAGGAVLTTAAGARRTDTAYGRYLRYARAADVVISPAQT